MPLNRSCREELRGLKSTEPYEMNGRFNLDVSANGETQHKLVLACTKKTEHTYGHSVSTISITEPLYSIYILVYMAAVQNVRT